MIPYPVLYPVLHPVLIKFYMSYEGVTQSIYFFLFGARFGRPVV